MLLIYPPSARSAEPPLGLARLAGILRAHGREALCIDLCQEGVDHLLGLETAGGDTWTRGALRRREHSARVLRDPDSYRSFDRYCRAVRDLNRAMRAASAGAGEPGSAEASLADYRETSRSPLRRSDLLDSARDFESNIFYPLFEGRVGPALERGGDGIVGLSICYLSQALCAFALIGFIRSRMPASRIVLGGGLITSWVAGGAISADESFGGLVDALLPGPGEDGLPAFLRIGEESNPRSRVGTTPDFDDFHHLQYCAPARIVPYNFSWGCPWKRCSFCPERAEGLPYRGTRASEATDQLRSLAARYGPGLFHFTDNEISPLYLRALADYPPGAPWYGFARFSRQLLDPGFCAALASSGCVMLQLGLESGDQRVLDALGKGTRLEEIETALGNLAASSIGVYLYVLFGTPAEDRGAALRTRDFIAAHAAEIDFLNVAIFNLPVSSPEAPGLETSAFYEGELSLYSDFRHPAGWDRSAVRDFLERDFGAVPAIRGIAKRTPPVFTSSHAPFFLQSRAGRSELQRPPAPGRGR
jgi:hypothetical protein